MRPHSVLIILLALSVAACSQTYFVKLEGRSASDLGFCFYSNLNDDANPTSHKVVDLLVQKYDPVLSDWRTIWEIQGPADISCVKYGAVSSSYKTATVAEPIENNGKYRVASKDDSAPIGYAALDFAIDQDGNVVNQK